MNLLPKTDQEFSQVKYWDKFFKMRGAKSFEWYGEYLELCEPIHKYIKTVDKILMVGCGNSKLSMDMFDCGYKDITNIDISQVAIKKMIEQNKRTRSEMKFLHMDATEMTFKDEMFSVALDKGTLDALMCDSSDEILEKAQKYFNEIARIMRNGGRYFCVSLLQEHILQYILQYFPQHSFMVRIVRCLEAEKATAIRAEAADAITMPVFVVIATKFKSLTSPILEFSMNGEKMQRMKDTQELIDAIGSVQAATLICNGISRRNIADLSEISLDLCRPGEEKSRYTVHILEQLPSKSLGKYAAFIIPQGREIEWLFSTVEGRKKLLESAGFQRLSVVTLHSGQEYASLDAVKGELTESIKTFAPFDSSDQIPILSLGSDVGKRVTLVTGFSQISGEFRIEEVEGNDGNLYRRLIFLNNQFLVQSEALIKIIKPKGKKERKKIAAGYLACHYHRYMTIGIQMATHNAAKDDQKDVLVVGLGGGGLCTFLHEALMNVRVTAVEIDPIMLEVAEQYFELKQDKRLHVVIDDGLSFIAKCKTEGVIKFNAILFDVDSKDNSLGISCPPSNFLAIAALENVKDILNARGLFILNLVCRDVKLRDQVVEDLKKVFDAVCCYKVDEDVNEVMFCYSGPKDLLMDDWKKMLGLSARNLNHLLKAKKLINDDICDMTDFLNQLKI